MINPFYVHVLIVAYNEVTPLSLGTQHCILYLIEVIVCGAQRYYSIILLQAEIIKFLTASLIVISLGVYGFLNSAMPC